MLIEIKTIDPLFFRDEKSFTMGIESWADGIFPPRPSTLYGALRASYLQQKLEDCDKKLSKNDIDTDKDPTKNLKISGIFYQINNDKKRKGNIYIPIPADFIEDTASDNNNRFLLSLQKTKKYYGNLHFDYLLKPDKMQSKKIKSASGSLISLEDFNLYLKNILKNNIIETKKIFDFVIPEYKVGIGISYNSRTTKAGQLYRIGLNRIKDEFSILIKYDGINKNEFEKINFMKLGGEGKIVKCKELTNKPKIEIPEFNTNDKYFKLILLTPALFKKGWFPSWINDDFSGTIPNTNIKIKLINVVTGKYINIGGFDIKKQQPKPMRRFVPAGSVYYFMIESNNFNWNDIINNLHEKSITENLSNANNKDSILDYTKQGFGISCIGKLNIKEE